MEPVSLAVGIATAGRRAVLSETLRELAHQTRLPDRVFICPAGDDDFDETEIAALPFPVTVIKGKRGLCAQRNLILDAARDHEFLVFFDDDFFRRALICSNSNFAFSPNRRSSLRQAM